MTEEELQGAAGGIFLLAYTYEFNLTELASGQIRIPDAQCVERDIPRHILTISFLLQSFKSYVIFRPFFENVVFSENL